MVSTDVQEYLMNVLGYHKRGFPPIIRSVHHVSHIQKYEDLLRDEGAYIGVYRVSVSDQGVRRSEL